MAGGRTNVGGGGKKVIGIAFNQEVERTNNIRLGAIGCASDKVYIQGRDKVFSEYDQNLNLLRSGAVNTNDNVVAKDIIVDATAAYICTTTRLTRRRLTDLAVTHNIALTTGSRIIGEDANYIYVDVPTRATSATVNRYNKSNLAVSASFSSNGQCGAFRINESSTLFIGRISSSNNYRLFFRDETLVVTTTGGDLTNSAAPTEASSAKRDDGSIVVDFVHTSTKRRSLIGSDGSLIQSLVMDDCLANLFNIPGQNTIGGTDGVWVKLLNTTTTVSEYAVDPLGGGPLQGGVGANAKFFFVEASLPASLDLTSEAIKFKKYNHAVKI
jgi:hypothetical protein